jgi:carbon storage regulator
MLVLRRRTGEAIVVGGDIEIEVMEISRTRVKIGVRAPRNVSVVRRETVTLAAENRRASDLIANRGTNGVTDLLRLLQQISSESLKAASDQVDM